MSAWQCNVLLSLRGLSFTQWAFFFFSSAITHFILPFSLVLQESSTRLSMSLAHRWTFMCSCTNASTASHIGTDLNCEKSTWQCDQCCQNSAHHSLDMLYSHMKSSKEPNHHFINYYILQYNSKKDIIDQPCLLYSVTPNGFYSCVSVIDAWIMSLSKFLSGWSVPHVHGWIYKKNAPIGSHSSHLLCNVYCVQPFYAGY